MILNIDLQYFPTIISTGALLKATHINFDIYDDWHRRSFRNRMVVASAGGLLTLSIPVEGGRNQKSRYRDIKIDHSGNWQLRHWRSIFSAYGKSPWFFHYSWDLEMLYLEKDIFLVDWNLRCLEWVFAALKIQSPLTNSNAISMEGFQAPESGVTAEDCIFMVDRVMPANFQDEALGPFPKYPQVFEDRLGFQANLSVLDLICCTGPESGSFLKQD